MAQAGIPSNRKPGERERLGIASGHMRFDEGGFRAVANRDRALRGRKLRSAAFARDEDEMNGLFEPRLGRNRKDGAVGREGGCEGRDNVALGFGLVRKRVRGAGILFKAGAQRLERHPRRILHRRKVGPEQPVHEHGAVGVQMRQRFADRGLDADIRRHRRQKPRKRMNLRHQRAKVGIFPFLDAAVRKAVRGEKVQRRLRAMRGRGRDARRAADPQRSHKGRDSAAPLA